MILIYTLAVLLIAFIVTDLARGIKINLHAVLNREDSKVIFTFLYPLIKAETVLKNGAALLTVYLFTLKAFSSKLKRKRPADIGRLMRSLKVSNVEMSALYGFKDPSVTGLVCGSAGALSSFIHIKSLKLMPDFLSDENYLNMDACAVVGIGHTIIDYLKNK
jgi:hypothetical protein